MLHRYIPLNSNNCSYIGFCSFSTSHFVKSILLKHLNYRIIDSNIVIKNIYTILAVFQRRRIMRNEACPFLSRHHVDVSLTKSTHLRHRYFLGCPLILESKLLLHTFRFLVAIIVATPHPGKFHIFKGVAQQFPCCLRNKTLAPVGYTHPISKLRLVILFSKVTVKMQTNAANR